MPRLTRRDFIVSSAAAGLAAAAPWPSGVLAAEIRTKTIPATGEAIPAVGMGTWITFNVGEDIRARNQRTEVLRNFFAQGGGMIDSSPMYGSSEAVIGYGLDKLGPQPGLFSATKVWTPFGDSAAEQVSASERLWGVRPFDLMQIHNLVSWQTHMDTLLEMKKQGRIRYIGVTTSHGRRHRELERIMENEPIDFVQLTYNVLDREPESRLLPLARERGLAVIANRPFRRGALFDRYQHKPLPAWINEFDAANWAQFFLKFIISHPALTCAIPATTRVDHMLENMGALHGRLPDAEMRARMARYVEEL
jgi:diketogulonate reductase-like aldo/keto reductase